MYVRRSEPGLVAASWAVGLLCLIVTGCFQQDDLQYDADILSSRPSSADSARPSVGPNLPGDQSAGPASGTDSNNGPVGARASKAPLRPEEVERQLRLALRTIERGDRGKGAELLDEIL